MPAKGSPRRYAEVIFSLAQEHQDLEEWVVRLQTLADLLRDEELRGFLESPGFHLDEKVNVIRELLSHESPRLQNLLALLTSRQHVRLASAILEEYRRMAYASLGIAEAQVTTAVPMEAEQQSRLASQLSRMVNREVRVQPRVDPSILGGFVARLGDRLFDGSVRARLEALRQQLRVGPV